jgi:glycosyltransferase involved in cell wall biosynthesis
MSTKVSVIVATYNYGAFMAEALRSVETQTFRDWECIVIDDASTDDTSSIVQAFVERDARFKYERLDQNSGVSVARNRGFALAAGEYIQLLDADDVIAPQKLELQVAYLDHASEVDVVHGDYVRFTGTPDLSKPGELKADEKVGGDARALVSRLLRGNPFRLNTMLFRRGVLDKVHGFRPEFRHVEDWDFWIRIAIAGKRFHFLDDPLTMAGVRVDHGSLSKDLPAMRKYQLPIRQYMFVHGQLSLKDRISALIRYCDFMLEMAVIKQEPVVFLDDGRVWFVPLVSMLSVVLFPVWLIMRPFIRPLS